MYFVVVVGGGFVGGRDIDDVVVGGFTLTEHKPMCVCQYKPPTPFDVFIDQPILPTNPKIANPSSS